MKNGDPPRDIDEYIARYPEDVQEVLQAIRVAVRAAAPHASEAIKYGMPTFVGDGNIVHFGAYKKHIGMYPAPRGSDEFQVELSMYEGEKGTVRFPLDKPMPLDLIRRIVEFRIREMKAKSNSERM